MRDPFLPVPVAELELSDAGAFDRPPRPNARGEIFLLVRIHGRPLSASVLQGIDPENPAAGLRAALPPQVLAAAREHLVLDGADPNRPGEAAAAHCPRRPDAAGLRISVVVCTTGTEPAIHETVRAVLGQDHPPHEVIVVDNAPHLGTVADHLADIADARLRIVPEPRAGLSAARNAGIGTVTAPVVAFTDDDAVPDRRWLRSLGDVFVHHPEVACVTGLVLPAQLSTPEQVWFERFGGFGKGFSRQVWRLAADPATDPIGPAGPRSPIFPYAAGSFGSGNNMAFAVAALRSAGAFDTALGAGTPTRGGEDLDAFINVLLAGGTLVYEPSAVVHHIHRADIESLREQLYGYGTGMAAMVTKHVLSSPGGALGVLRRLPAGLRHLLHPESAKNSGKRAGYPSELTRLELKGYLYGPGLYLRSKASVRRAVPTGSP